MKLEKFIRVSPGFQYSVNIKYDLHNQEKITAYIPIKQSADLINSLVQTIAPENTERSHLLIGSYGTGKSHFCAVLLALLSRPKSYLKKWEVPLLTKLRNISPATEKNIVEQFNKPRMLPVIVNGNGSSFEQALLIGLQAALEEADIKDCLPQTAFTAANQQVEEWEMKYPAAYFAFIQCLEALEWSIEQWKRRINEFDPPSYFLFERVYPEITNGAKFNPLFQGSVGDIYLSVAQSIQNRGYQGIYVVFDEFGQFLENQWEKNNGAQLKSVQDFAEACNASSERMLQLLIVTHKPIVQYAAKYGEDEINEWRKIEGRFKLHELSSTSVSMYELISQVILKDADIWDKYKSQYYERFNALREGLSFARLFSDLSVDDFLKYVVEGSYPLHPVTTFCLPRFASQVAQNERTIFTFLSTNDFHSLGWFIREASADFPILTLDVIFDYFEQQIQVADAEERIRSTWFATKGAINRIEDVDSPFDELKQKANDAIKLLKALAIIRILNLPGVFPPTQVSLKLTFAGSELDETRLGVAIQHLINKGILFEGGSTGNLEIIELGEIDVPGQLSQLVIKRKQSLALWSFLNDNFRPEFVLAKKYNDEYFMTRYFSSSYISGNEILRDGKLCIDAIASGRDGHVYYVIPSSVAEWEDTKVNLDKQVLDRCVFILPSPGQISQLSELETTIRQIDALKYLLKQIDESKEPCKADRLLVLLWLHDKENIVRDILKDMFDWSGVSVFPKFRFCAIRSRADLSRLVSEICSLNFPDALKWNNEMINKHRLTRPIQNARRKVVHALLRADLQLNLGLTGTGPEVSIFRSLLKHTQIITTDGVETRLNYLSNIPDLAFIKIMNTLQDLFDNAGEEGVSFKKVLNVLMDPPFGIRLGVVPLIIALYIHRNRQELILVTSTGEEVTWSAEEIDDALNDPEQYVIYRYEWTDEKAYLCNQLQQLFVDYAEIDDASIPTRRTVNMMKRWLLSLPRFTRDTRNISVRARNFRKLLKQWNMPSSQLLFQELPEVIDEQYDTEDATRKCIIKVAEVKSEMEGHLYSTLYEVETSLKLLLPDIIRSKHLLGSMRGWYETLSTAQKQYSYSDGTQEMINLIAQFRTENSEQFLKELSGKLAGIRPEDWNDSMPRQVAEQFALALQEVFAHISIAACTSDTRQFSYSFANENGEVSEKIFKYMPISKTGGLLQNVLSSYLFGFGDAVSKNEKRQILIELLESITDR